MIQELTELQDVRSQNEDKVLQSTDEGINQVKRLTGTFKKYLENFDLRNPDG